MRVRATNACAAAQTIGSVRDSTGSVSGGPAGLSDEVLNELLAFKSGGASLHGFVPSADGRVRVESLSDADGSMNFSRAIMVDCSASDDTTPLLLAAARSQASCALANKKPLSGPQQDFDELTAAPPRFRYCAAAGAGVGAGGCVGVGVGVGVEAGLEQE
jgi:hypothetical protein